MGDIRNHSATNAYFRDNFKRLAGTKTQKGDLNTSDGSVIYDVGILLRIEKKKILQNGWIVEVNDKTYHCSNDSDRLTVPKHTESKEYYVPNEKIQVDVSLDTKNKIYKLLRMRLSNEDGVSVVQSNGQLTLLSPSASSILPFVSSSHESKEETKKKQQKADGSAIALREDSISLVGKVYVNNVNLEKAIKDTQDALNNTVTTSSATQMETVNTTISSSELNVTFEHTYSEMPNINITNSHQDNLDYNYTFITDSQGNYTGAYIYFGENPTQQSINILIVGTP